MNINDRDFERALNLSAARVIARLMAQMRPDYHVLHAADVSEDDRVRLVPSHNLRVPAAWADDLLVIAVTQEFGLVAVTVRPDAPGDPSPDNTVVLDYAYPILVHQDAREHD